MVAPCEALHIYGRGSSTVNSRTASIAAPSASRVRSVTSAVPGPVGVTETVLSSTTYRPLGSTQTQVSAPSTSAVKDACSPTGTVSGPSIATRAPGVWAAGAATQAVSPAPAA